MKIIVIDNREDELADILGGMVSPEQETVFTPIETKNFTMIEDDGEYTVLVHNEELQIFTAHQGTADELFTELNNQYQDLIVAAVKLQDFMTDEIKEGKYEGADQTHELINSMYTAVEMLNFILQILETI